MPPPTSPIPGNLFILSAPSGAGKTSIVKPVVAGLDRLAFSVSHTTRAPRSGERDRVDYHFTTRPEFEAMIARHDFLEWAEVHGNLYGTSRTSVEARRAEGLDIILDIDVQGAAQIRSQGIPGACFIFIAPPSIEELRRRLTSRGTDRPETIELRLKNATTEMAAMPLYDYVIVNEALGEAIDSLRAIVIEKRLAARRSLSGIALPLANILPA